MTGFEEDGEKTKCQYGCEILALPWYALQRERKIQTENLFLGRWGDRERDRKFMLILGRLLVAFGIR